MGVGGVRFSGVFWVLVYGFYFVVVGRYLVEKGVGLRKGFCG